MTTAHRLGISIARSCGVCERDGIHGAHVPLHTGRSPYSRGSSRSLFTARRRMKSRLFGHALDRYPACDKELVHQVQAHVAAIHSASQSDAFKQCNKLGYHPLEELSQSEKKQLEQQQHGKLTDAELARTIAEVNSTAVLLAAFSPRISVLGTEVHYLVDEQGDFYFGIDNDNEFLRNIPSSPTCSVLIGIENLDDIMISDLFSVNDDELDTELDTDEESEDEGDELSEDWDLLILDDAEEDSLSSSESWGGLKTLNNVHPMNFASKLSETATRDSRMSMYKPSKKLKITGVVRQVTKEEEPYIRKLWNDRHVSDDDDDFSEDEEEDKPEHEAISSAVVVENLEFLDDASYNIGNKERVTKDGALEASEVLKLKQEEERKCRNTEGSLELFIDVALPNEDMITTEPTLESRSLDDESGLEKMTSSNAEMATDISLTEESSVPRLSDITPDGPTILSEWYEEDEPGSLFYKLEIFSIELNASPGNQSSVEIKDFLYAKPDIIGHDASSLVDQINAGGKKFETALKLLCQREKGIQVEEASVVGIDSLGMDVRISCGIEIKNVRFSFNKRAKCADSAEKLVNQLLYSRPGAKHNRKGRRMKE
ncbi:hypothetical protein O6H91_01G009100 [Diphasiastrum complanatum]|uniref:Uncharacterized protein n=1 Tax=Diphasiastrum complanatum TaxID=34168 RepID=A0ACC2EMY0_DIPCM|nr:hypothetical protein O6H91_Y275600 [Diphasiastrum complanatum]KAJ7567829.1 hypothetical protein O6H91_01G009100 [Diphasiastrum complanatum]